MQLPEHLDLSPPVAIVIGAVRAADGHRPVRRFGEAEQVPTGESIGEEISHSLASV